MRITILIDDSGGAPPLVQEHGLSVWIEDGDVQVLFDTGQGTALAPNCRALGVSLSQADAIILSHGHYDHTGGLPDALEGRSGVPVLAHPAVLSTRYSRSTGEMREIGMPEAARTAVAMSGQLIPTLAPGTAAGRVRVTGPLPRSWPTEQGPRVLFADPGGREVDTFPDDQAAFVETANGVVVILGCAHAGVVDTVRHVEFLSGARVRVVLGGMHLGSATAGALDATICELGRRNLDLVVPCHCTGATATNALLEAFRGRCRPGRSGLVCEIEE